jgi:catecholate siderophore receptor
LWCTAALCSATADVAIVEGLVIDPSGAAESGARVAIAETRFTTDQEGKFSLNLPAGDYTVRVAADGFIEYVREVAVTPGGVFPIRIELQLEPRSDVVTVAESPGYQIMLAASATKTATPLIDVPQAISIVNSELIKDQLMMSVGDAVRYVPGVTAIQGENNRDQVVIRGNSSSADFFVNGVRDDVQYYRDLYNVEQLEALKGPNAMIFGRGGGGGVVNRVTKEASSATLREFDFQGGSFGGKRFAMDWDQPAGGAAAIRFNGMYQGAGSFRDGVDLERYGINPTATLTPSPRTRLVLSYERFHDGRTADRGVPSYMGRPVDVPISTFYGNSSDSWVRAGVNLGSARFERQFGRINLRNSSLIGDYDRGYQNYVPGAVNAGRTAVALSAYNNATRRRNMFNQTDLTYAFATGNMRHTLLWGAELSRQNSDNFRNTGYFNNTSTSIAVPYASPSVNIPVIFRQSATDADNHVKADVAAGYVQDHIELSRFFQVLLGARFDRFNLEFQNNRTGESLQRIDHLISPRAGLVIKPAATVSVYGTYSVSWLPSAGDQFSSLTAITQQVKPEKFKNYETGVKWDFHRDLSVTAAAYRLDRTNTRSTDPNDPTRIIQTGRQRSEGIEIGVTGHLTRKWQVNGGYAFQDVRITAATLAAKAGAQVAQTPHHAFSLWSRYQASQRLSLGLGILNRADMYAGIDNTVVLPGYARADAAIFYSLTEQIRIQANVENVFNRKYYINADGNNNISPGSPRAARLGVIARF